MFNISVPSFSSIILWTIFCWMGTEAVEQNRLRPGNPISLPLLQTINPRAGMGGPAVTSSPTVFTMLPTSTIPPGGMVVPTDVVSSVAAPSTTPGGTPLTSVTAMISSSPVIEILTTQTATSIDDTRTFWVIETPTDSGGPTSTVESTTTVPPSDPTTFQTTTSTSDLAGPVVTAANANIARPTHSSKLLLIIGIAAPAGAGIMIAALWWCIRRRRNKAKEENGRNIIRNGGIELPNRGSTNKPPRTSGTGRDDRRSKTKQAPLSLKKSISYPIPVSPEEAGASPEYYSIPPAPPIPPTPVLPTASRTPPPKYASPVTSLRSPPPRPPRPQSTAQTTLGGVRERFDASTIAESHNGAPPLSAGRTPFSIIDPERILTPEPSRAYNPDFYVPDTEYGRDRGHAPSSSEPYRTGYNYNRGRDDDRSTTPRPLNVVKRSASDNLYERSVAPTTGYAPESIIDDYAERQTIPDSVYDDVRRHSNQGSAYAYLEGRERQLHSPPPLLKQIFSPSPMSEDGSSVYTSDTYGKPYRDSHVITDEMRRKRRERLELEEERERAKQAEWMRSQGNI